MTKTVCDWCEMWEYNYDISLPGEWQVVVCSWCPPPAPPLQAQSRRWAGSEPEDQPCSQELPPLLGTATGWSNSDLAGPEGQRTSNIRSALSLSVCLIPQYCPRCRRQECRMWGCGGCCSGQTLTERGSHSWSHSHTGQSPGSGLYRDREDGVSW